MKKPLLVSFLAVTAIIGAALTFVPSAHADDENLRGALYMSPSKVELETIHPGETYTSTIEAYNAGDTPLAFNVSAETMIPSDENYAMTWGASPSQYHKIIDWIEFDTGTYYEIEPEGKTEVTFTVNVPDDAAGGAQHFMLLAKQVGSQTGAGNSWQVESAIGIQVYSNVDGAISLGGRVIAQEIPKFSFDPVIRTFASVENTGNINFDANFKVEIRNYFGDSLAWDSEDADQTKLILPETKRLVRQDWEQAPQLGLFRVTSTVTIPGEAPSVLDQVVLIIPVWLIILIVLIIVLLVVGIVYKVKKGKNSKHF